MRACVTLCAAGLFFLGGLSITLAEEPKVTTPEEKFFNSLDKDKDGKLSKEEFIANSKDKPVQKARQEALFIRCDKDKDGFVTFDEYKAVIGKRGK